MIKVFKRFINVLTILTTLYLMVLVFLAMAGHVSNWEDFFSVNGAALVFLYGINLATNYIFFGLLSIWHSNVDQ